MFFRGIWERIEKRKGTLEGGIALEQRCSLARGGVGGGKRLWPAWRVVGGGVHRR